MEDLAVGDLAVTASGAHRSIRWLGHRTVDCTRNPGPRALWPVRVAAHAFGENKPSVDLYLSPGHSVCVTMVSEIPIPIQELVNGSTLAYVPMDSVTYWHVELDSHDLLLANNLPAESFLEMGSNRACLDDAVAADLPMEVLARTHADFCRPFVDGGLMLAVAREQLACRAAELGWVEDRTVTIVAEVDSRRLAPLVRDGEAIFALPAGAAAVTLHTDLTSPALLGGADPRALGIAVYTLELVGADGEVRQLNLDAEDLAPYFHAGERADALHYRWSAGDIAIPPRAGAGLAEPIMLRLAYEPGTVRGWIGPAHRPQRPKLRVVG